MSPVLLLLLAVQPPARPLADYRQVAGGDAARGARLFADPQAACAVCHTADGRGGGKPGPALLGIADKLDRAGLIRAVLEPSADILPGYETTVVTTTAGATHSGILRFAGAQAVELVAADGQPVRVARADVESLTVARQSVMPEGLHARWSPAEFADLIAYLETLHLPPPAAARPDNPAVIARAARPLRVVPLVGPEVRLSRPVWFGPLPGHPGSYLAAEIERARVWRVEPAGGRKELFVDLHAETRHGYIEGLLGLALHPDFARNRRYFVALHDPARDKVAVNVWERRAAADGRADAGTPPRKLLTVDMPHVNHNGCCLEFGPDGKLYVGFGDGGPQEDPDGHSQNLGSLLGKILRLDVGDGTGDKSYTSPADNPFAARAGARPEVWALGFREPWRFSFDRRTGDLWVGDVGQNRFEEVAVVRAGENHGWNVVEGFAAFSDRHRRAGEKYVPPILSYDHRHGVSVTGGYVYRGTKAPALAGTYIFGDYETRRIWGLTHKDRKLTGLVELGRSPSRIAAFGEDADGELLLVGHDPHAVYRLDLSGVDSTPVLTQELVATSEAAGLPWRHTLAAPPAGWEAADFDDRGWATSPGGFGTRGTPGAVVRTEWRTADIWLRREFTLSAADVAGLETGAVALRLHHDEDAEIFLNGVSAARPRGWTGGYTELPAEPAAVRALRPGRNVIAVHCHQVSGGQYIDVGLVRYRPAAGK